MLNDSSVSLSSFEWASVSQYLVYVSSAAGLEEINSNHVTSFPLARLGPGKVIRQKERVLAKLRWNQRHLERFVGARKDGLENSEKAVLRSMYLQYRRNIETVEDHLRIAGMYGESVVNSQFQESKEVEDDLLF